MDSYGVFADYYDALTLNVDYKKRAEYILNVFKKLGHDMGLTLDLACGTGKLTLELKKRGVDIYGVDASENMLTRAFENCEKEGLSVLFLHQKMQELDLYGGIDTCICTLDSINHMINPDDVQKTFDRVSLFMNPDGYFLFDVNSVYKHRKILADNTFVYDMDEVYCVWENSLKENNIIEIDINLFIPNGELYLRSEEHFCERAYSDEDISKMLKNSGFEVVSRFGDMRFEPPKDDEQRIIYVARKI